MGAMIVSGWMNGWMYRFLGDSWEKMPNHDSVWVCKSRLENALGLLTVLSLSAAVYILPWLLSLRFTV